MALSYVTYPADGVTTQYDITFGYLARSHVFVFVDDQLRSFRWVTGTRVELNTAPNPGEVVKLQRLTDRVTRITDFVDGQTLLAGDLDAGDLQNFYIVQELLDEIYDGVITGTVPVRDPGTSFVSVQWIQDQLESNQLTSQAFSQLLQQITDEETARAQAITAEAQARIQGLADEALARANEIGNLAGTVSGNHAAFLAENQQRIDDIAAEATRLDGVVTRVDSAEAGILSNQQAISNEAGARTAEITQANSRIDDVEADVTSVTNTQATDNQARIDDITAANAATAAAQADATSALSLVATETSSRVSDVARLDARHSSLPALTFANPDDWTRDQDGEPQDVASVPASEFTNGATIGHAWNRQQAGTIYQKAVHKVVPGDVFRARAAINVGALGSNGYCSCVFVFITMDGTYTQLGGRNFYGREDFDSTGKKVLEFEVSADTLLTDEPNGQWVRVGVELLRDSTAGVGEAWLREFLVDKGPGTALASLAKATADTNTQLIASETAARASELSTLEATFTRRLDGNRLLDNDTFQEDPIGYTGVPSGWSNWDGGDQAVINAKAESGPGVVAYLPGNPSGNRGWYQWAYGIQPGARYIVTARVRRRGGPFKAAGVFINWRKSDGATSTGNIKLPFATSTTLEGPSGEYPDGTVTYAWEVTANANSETSRAVVYAMNQWNGFNADTSNACDIDWYELSVQPADYSAAGVSILKDALATGSSSQARLFLGVNTTNNEAFLEAYAGEGDGVWNGSKIKMKADEFEFDGDVIIDGTITANNLQDGAATKGWGATTDNEATLSNNVWTNMRTVTVTTLGGLVYLHGNTDVDVRQAAGQSGLIDAQVRLLRGSTVIRTRAAGGTYRMTGSQAGTEYNIQGPGDIMELDQPPAGTHTYYLQVKMYNGSAGQGHRKCRNRSLAVLELRR